MDAERKANRDAEAELGLSPGADLEPEEAADAFETLEEAREAKQTREDQRDDDNLISLDSGD